MSVPKSKRGESKFEVMIHALKMRREFTMLLLRDFGVKNKIRDFRFVAEFNEDDKKVFDELAEKYDFKHTLKAIYPEWLIDHFRGNIIKILAELVTNIISANSIYVTNESEYNERRSYQTKAICNCENLLQEMQYVISILSVNVDINKYTRYVEMIDKQIALLRAWRKTDNKIKNRVNSVGRQLGELLECQR